ncbi:MAG TPA: hypothetical protein VGO55_12065 [Allosphingosinicella sp.]|jgi:hypothetical protein|nr:hypothetical protein [Allosphingosinicella sp.]
MPPLVLSALLAALPAPASQDVPAAHAVPDGAACAAYDENLPAWLQPWTNVFESGSEIVPGRAVTIFLRSLGVGETMGPPRKGWRGATTGRTLSFDIDTAGTYAIVLDIPAWIELAWRRGDRNDSHGVESVSHAHGPPCSTIRKIVNFQLIPGNYTVQLSGTNAASARLLIVKR